METIIEAKALLRHYLVHRSEGVNRLGKIVEVEACLEKHGLASYSSKGLNARERCLVQQDMLTCI